MTKIFNPDQQQQQQRYDDDDICHCRRIQDTKLSSSSSLSLKTKM